MANNREDIFWLSGLFFTIIGLMIGNLMSIGIKSERQRFFFNVAGIVAGQLLALWAKNKFFKDGKVTLGFLD